MSAVAFDNTFLSALLNPNGKPVRKLGTTEPVEFARERAESVIQKLERARRKIILPTPACAELLTAIGPEAQQYMDIVARSRVFEFGDFDHRGARELAWLNRNVFVNEDQIMKAEPYQKRKVDRQIIAICKVYGVSEIYTDDGGLAKHARLCQISPIFLSEVPLPESARQGQLDLEPHDEVPIVEHEDEPEDFD